MGSLDLKVYDYKAASCSRAVRREGRISCTPNTRHRDVLFMFTQYTTTFKLIYLNNFTPIPMHIYSRKPGEHTITARALTVNFGYKDKSVSVTFNVQIKPEKRSDIYRLI